ncbi:MAG: ATP-binding protein, partial [Desulfobacteraceae bacterium]
EAQLRRSQKMESIGRLAGGVAHDFNNMLSVILGHTQLAINKISPDDQLYQDLSEVLSAAERSTQITRQLLAFARKQAFSPQVLDLNETIDGMLKMLQRLIGEDLELVWLPGKELWPVKMDPSQVDQILANLCVNARDALEGGGKITIETHPVTLDKPYCAAHPDFSPGEYVLLAVSDNGCGMDRETRDRVFEPFFTTKDLNEGTGLGLSTVYGIVKQNSGFINVYSEPGRGTTFKIYLPRNTGNAGQVRPRDKEQLPLGQGETVLIVEDEASVLELSQKMLEKLGYTVLTGSTPGEAIELAEGNSARIDLLMTDVVMPEMNGKDFAQRLRARHPDLKVLFMSGYPASIISNQGQLEEDINFLEKPFSMSEMALKVREALEGGSRRGV